MKNLSDVVTRCSDENCVHNKECLRFLCKDDPDTKVKPTLKVEPTVDYCDCFISKVVW